MCCSHKDLSYLNRDLSKVILLDTHEEHTLTHPENAIVLPKWTGTPGDRGLVAMIPFLECMPFFFPALCAILMFISAIGIYKPPDVRPILQAYQGKDIPIEYGKKEAEARERHIAEWKGKSKGLSSGGFTMSSLFGVSTEVRCLYALMGPCIDPPRTAIVFPLAHPPDIP